MTPRRAGTVALAAVAIALLALTLRIAVASLSPLIEVIRQDFSLPPATVGLIGMAPPVAFAVASLVTPAIERRVGLERLVLIAAIGSAAMLALRATAGSAVMLLAATGGVFLAVGAANVLIPAVVKKYFPGRIGLMTTVYSTSMAIATFVPPFVAVPLADAVGWRTTFGLWAAVALTAVVPWVALALRARVSRADRLEEPRASVLARVVRVPQTWALVVSFVVTSSVAYTCFAWLPEILRDVAGVNAAEAGGLLALFSFMGLPMSLLVPALVARSKQIWPFYAVAVIGGFAAVAGLLFAPAAAPALWVVLLGFPPMLFPLTLVLFGLRTRSHDTSVALSGIVQCVGYGLTAALPLALGVTHEVTGGWTVGIILIAAVTALAIPSGIMASRNESIEDAWERRNGRRW